MKTLSEYYSKTLHLIQPSIWKRYFELWDDKEIIGTLFYPKYFSLKADVKIFNSEYEFYEPHWWKNLIEVKEAGKDLPIANYKPPAFKRKGKLELPQGESVFFCSSLFNTSFEITDKWDKKLISFKSSFSFKVRLEVTIEGRGEVLDKYPWILFFIYYVISTRKRKNSAG